MSPVRDAFAFVVLTLIVAIGPVAVSAAERGHAGPGAPGVPGVPFTGAQNDVPAWRLAPRRNEAAVATAPQTWVPPTFATAPRAYPAVYGPQYFERWSYAGPAQRGRAFDVRRRSL